MKIKYQDVLKPLYLHEYAESYKDQDDPALMIWVNPPRELLKGRALLDDEYTQIVREFQDKADDPKAQKKFESAVEEFVQRSHVWYARIWSQGPPDTHWTVEEINELNERDPALLAWLCERTRIMLQEHREHQKNA